jgi:L-lactate utilization protein LutC
MYNSQEVNENLVAENPVAENTNENPVAENPVNENEEEKQQILDDVLSQLSEILKDNKMEQFAKMDMSNMEREMNIMVEELKKKNNDPNIMSMLNLFNNLSISNLTDSNFSLGDCDVSNLGKSNTFSDTSDEDDYDDEENYEPNHNFDNSSTDTDEELLDYMKDREENEDMVLSIKQKLEEID